MKLHLSVIFLQKYDIGSKNIRITLDTDDDDLVKSSGKVFMHNSSIPSLSDHLRHAITENDGDDEFDYDDDVSVPDNCYGHHGRCP